MEVTSDEITQLKYDNALNARKDLLLGMALMNTLTEHHAIMFVKY